MRAIFFDDSAARSAAARLVAAGYSAETVRERLAGEDDEEDHPWAVLSDAPEFVMDMLADEFDGWLDLEEPAAAAPELPPLVLPQAPQRVKRPDAQGPPAR
ncbi:MAG: hypothetical protein ACI379_13475 [Nocardioides sp.]|uniref:hypothetical protein n=1 Tax=Nocardioides sp. TaxID=35761 RepID=UPI003F028ED0